MKSQQLQERTNVIGIYDLMVFTTRVLIWYDKETEQYIAQSLELGKVTTAMKTSQVKRNIIQLISDDCKEAFLHSDFKTLLEEPADYGVWMDWLAAVSNGAQIEDNAISIAGALRVLVRIVEL